MAPLYDFECPNAKCEKADKVMQFIVPLARYDEKIKCPKCGKPLTRMLSTPYFKIK